LNGSGAIDLVRTTSSTSFTQPFPLGGGTIPFPIVYFMLLHKDYIQMSFFPGISKWESQNWILVIPKLWMFISFSNQVSFENSRALSYSPQKCLSYGLYHTRVKFHFTPTFKGFVVRSQIPNLTPTLFFYHNSCKSCLNGQCKGTSNVYDSIPF
jgi:hypothetical protein